MTTVKNIFDKVTSWPQLISKFLPFAMLLLIGLAPFTPRVFLFNISLLFGSYGNYQPAV